MLLEAVRPAHLEPLHLRQSTQAEVRAQVVLRVVAAAAAYLLSDDARNVSGTTLYVDAGYHAMGM